MTASPLDDDAASWITRPSKRSLKSNVNLSMQWFIWSASRKRPLPSLSDPLDGWVSGGWLAGWMDGWMGGWVVGWV